jgi:hypothetical protein
LGGARSLLVSSNLRGGERLTWLVHSAFGPFGKSRRGSSLRSWPGRSTRTPRPAAGGSVGRVIVKVFPPSRRSFRAHVPFAFEPLFSTRLVFFLASLRRRLGADERRPPRAELLRLRVLRVGRVRRSRGARARRRRGTIGNVVDFTRLPHHALVAFILPRKRTAVLMTGLFGRVRRPDDGPLLEGTRELRVGGRCRRRCSG